MSFSQLILKDYADIAWPLDDITDSASLSAPINFFSPYARAYSASINLSSTSVQSVPMIFGGGSLLQFTSSAVGLSIPALGRFSDTYRDKNSVMSFWLKVDRVTQDEQPIFKKRGEDNVGLFIKNNYLIFKFGTSASYSKLAGFISELNEPHYIVVAAGPEYRSLMIDGVEYRTLVNEVNHPTYNSASYANNDVIDFYGPQNGLWEIDCPTFYPNLIDVSVAKRHYVYGLGKWVDDSVFFSRGGNIYNFTTLETEKIAEINWDYPDEWNLTAFKDLESNEDGIKPLSFSAPELYTFDNKIVTENNQIKFSSASNTLTSYIDITSVSNKILGGDYPFFIKVKLDGKLPVDQLSQRIISYGEVPDTEKMNIDLYNDSGQYKIKITANNYSGSVSFNISNISASPDIYIGMKFDGISTFYFAESGSAIQTASFNSNSASLVNDPLFSYFPPNNNTRIRIGGSLTYDLKNSIPSAPFDFNQFYGTFKKFLTIQPEDISSITSFNEIDTYRKTRYAFTYNSLENRFLVSTYGKGSFNIHSADIGEYLSSSVSILGSNVIEIGYPDIVSASNVIFNVTHYGYTGSVLHSTQRLDKKTFLGYLNNTNLYGSFLAFDFEIFTNDLLYYPPRIRYFHMETYKSNNSKTMLRDDAGQPYFLYPNSSSIVYLPETRLTPTIFIRDDSGIKLNGNIADFNEQIYPVPLDPRTIEGLTLWLDARWPLGLRRSKYEDDYRINQWIDLSGNEFNALQSSSIAQPVYRIQSLNIFTYGQLSGSEPNNLINIQPVNSTIESSIYGAIRGTKAIAVIPDGSSIDSYIDLGHNTASITVFPNQQYTAVGTLRLNKRQTASALYQYARSIVIYNSDGVSASISGISSQAANAPGTYSLSVTFSTNATTTQSFIRYYNGSYNQDDAVYWDNLGLYPLSSSIAYGSGGSASVAMPRTSWILPLTEYDDSPVIKFNGINTFMETAASVSQPYTMFIVGRAFNDGVFVGYSASGASLYTYDGNYYISTGSAQVQVTSTNDYSIYTIEVSSGSAKFYLNGEGWYLRETGHDDINGLLLGKGTLLDNSENYLAGDLAAVVLYAGEFDYQTRSAIENWLDESFNLLTPVIGVTPLSDRYLEEYTFRYPTRP